MEEARRRTAEWRIGTASSGPEPGHPFRGNQWTGGIDGGGGPASFGRHAKAEGFNYVPSQNFIGQPTVPTEGYAVVDPEMSTTFPDEGVEADQIEGWILDNEDLWFTAEMEEIFNKYAGVYYNPATGTFTLAGTLVVPTPEEAAVLLSQYNQDAYYNIADGEAYDQSDTAEANSLPAPPESYPRRNPESRGQYPHRESGLRQQAPASAFRGLDPLLAASYRIAEWRYSPDQPRDDHGRFGEGDNVPGTSGEYHDDFIDVEPAAVEPAPPGEKPYGPSNAFDEAGHVSFNPRDTQSEWGAPIPAPTAWAKDLTPTQRRAMETYLSARGNRDINGGLRNRELGIDKNRTVKAIDSAIAGSTLRGETVLYRGLGTNKAFPVGTKITDAGFWSTSWNLQVAQAFANMRAKGDDSLVHIDRVYGGKPVVLELTVPAGTHAAAGDPGVSEFVLARGSSFVVTGKDSAGHILARPA